MLRNFFNWLTGPTTETEEENMFKIVEGTGGFFIVNARTNIAAEGTGSYSRARDARRGAERRGLVLA